MGISEAIGTCLKPKLHKINIGTLNTLGVDPCMWMSFAHKD